MWDSCRFLLLDPDGKVDRFAVAVAFICNATTAVFDTAGDAGVTAFFMSSITGAVVGAAATAVAAAAAAANM